MAFLDEFGNDLLGIAHAAVFPVVARLENPFGIQNAKLRLLRTGQHIQGSHGTRNVQHQHNINAIGIGVFHFGGVLGAGKSHNKAAQRGQTQGRHNMAHAYPMARGRLLGYSQGRKLNGTLTTLLAIDV